jgi:sugar-specific transcriptional regulator TrmB
MDYKFFQNFGFDEKEAKVYYALLKSKASSATQISYDTDIDRTLCYQILDRLLAKGIISESYIEGKKIFVAQNPDKLLSKLKNDIDVFESKKEELKEIYNKKPNTTKVEILFGKNSLKNMLDDILNEGKDYCCYGSLKNMDDNLPIKLIKFLKQLAKKGIKERLIQTKNEPQTVRAILGENKFVPENMIFPISTFIYGNNVSMIIWSDNITRISIHDEKIAQAHQKHFDFMWEKGEKE